MSKRHAITPTDRSEPLRDLPPNPLWEKAPLVAGRDGLVWVDAYSYVTKLALRQQWADARGNGAGWGKGR